MQDFNYYPKSSYFLANYLNVFDFTYNMKKVMLLIMFIVLSSCVFANPFRDVEIYIYDPLGEPVDGALVEMYATYNNYFNYSGVTNYDGYLLLEVDARIWELVQQQYENLTEGVNPNNNANRVPIKETTTRITSNVAKDDPKNSAKAGYPSYTLYPIMTFHYDLTSQGVYDFISMTFERSFSLRHNQELDFVVSDGTPLINLPDGLETNEDNNHEIIINLEDYITDYDNSFDELDITIIDEEWSAADASIEVVNNELVVDFLPTLNLDYHQDNTVTFTIKADDGVHINEKEYSYSYVPEYKALRGVVSDLYFYNFISDASVTSPNVNLDLLFDDEVFMGFYETNEDAIVHILKDDYYPSYRFIEFSEDADINFTIVPVRYNTTLGYDPYEMGYETSFQWLTQSSFRWISVPNITICTSNKGGYNPTPTDIVMVESILNYYYNFTLEFIDTHFLGNTMIINDWDECLNNGGIGYIVLYWNSSIYASGLNLVYTDGNAVIAGIAIYKGNIGQGVYSQEAIQVLGPHHDQDYIEPSVLCDSCNISSFPTQVDTFWGNRLYSRQTGNIAPDTDPEAQPKSNKNINNNIYDEVRYNFKAYINNKKVYLTKLLGYSPIDYVVKSEEEILTRQELPENAIIIKNEQEAIELKTKNQENKKKIQQTKINKIKKLLNTNQELEY